MNNSVIRTREDFEKSETGLVEEVTMGEMSFLRFLDKVRFVRLERKSSYLVKESDVEFLDGRAKIGQIQQYTLLDD